MKMYPDMYGRDEIFFRLGVEQSVLNNPTIYYKELKQLKIQIFKITTEPLIFTERVKDIM